MAEPEFVDLTFEASGAPPGMGRRPRRGKGTSATAAAVAAAAAAAAGGDPSPAAAASPTQMERKRRSAGVSGGSKRAKTGGSGAGGDKRVNQWGATVSWRPKASQDVRDRIARAMPGSGHRLFLIDRRQLRPVGAPEGAGEEFHVLGATGNVTVGRHPCCTCPDWGKGHVCKHYLFAMLRVLRLPADEPLVWQLALLALEADEVLGGLHSMRGGGSGGGGGEVVAPDAVRQQFRRSSMGAAGGADGGDADGTGQRPVEGDCPVCFDEMEASGEAVSWCLACGNNIHRSCMQHWASSKRAQRSDVTCPLCRAPWADGSAPPGAGAGGAAAAAAGGAGQYLNLAQYSEAHRGGASLEALYGERAMWIERGGGGGGRRDWRRWR
ncbi:SWIM zinc finger isoform B [Micractinium conductrix]|uniref:SWIM zinc finger isoform B n=1 Tax=Micractinium conductrix TaxID=554055 RepID=A0A2P6VJD3_9CHLO|nr:SWIM zinc finger isoform B [Micractinium conductrix]|eukprot:PSC74170.1 SWIM zinc finger isoform B [Micractinium conductrix]